MSCDMYQTVLHSKPLSSPSWYFHHSNFNLHNPSSTLCLSLEDEWGGEGGTDVTIHSLTPTLYEILSRSFRTHRLERELQIVELSATRFSFIAILWVSLVSFAAIILCVASRVFVFVVVVHFVVGSVRKLLDTPSYRDEWSVSRSGLFIRERNNSGAHCIRG